MGRARPRPLLRLDYEIAAQQYLQNLPLEHFMEGIGQSRQREITLESLALVRAERPDVHVFNEMLVQWPGKPPRKFGQVVPDNMVVISEKPLHAVTSYNVPLEPAPPFWVLEYVSPSNQRKDYEESFDKYEQELKVPYYLRFYPDNQEMTLFRLRSRGGYRTVKPNDAGRCAIRELRLEVALHEGWVRFWLRGALLPLPEEMQAQLNHERLARQRLEDEVARLRAKVAELERTQPD